MNQSIEKLCAYLDQSHSVYHAQLGIVEELKKAGYVRLLERDHWEIVPGGKYYVTRGSSAVLAFRVPEQTPTGFMMSASHSDRPSFKLKENFEMADAAYTRVAVERYGGMLVAPWLDRVLSIAGRVTVDSPEGIVNKIIDIDRDLLLIPNVAIHMNRTVNEGQKWNLAVDVIPLAGSKAAAGKLAAMLEKEAGGRILGHDLYLYVRQKAAVWGLEEEYISSQAIDDLQCAWGCTQGFLKSATGSAIPMLCILDSEEVGSISSQGAASTFISNNLSRICRHLGLDLEQMLAQSFMVSADNGHALHPNHPELADPANTPVMGGGVVIKYNANLTYCTDGVSAGIFRKLCEQSGVKVQNFWNRGDIPGGSTLGRISLGQVSVPTADIGLAQLAMHSSYETGSVPDYLALEKVMTLYFETALEVSENGCRIVNSAK